MLLDSHLRRRRDLVTLLVAILRQRGAATSRIGITVTTFDVISTLIVKIAPGCDLVNKLRNYTDE